MSGIQFDESITDPEQLAALFQQLESGNAPAEEVNKQETKGPEDPPKNEGETKQPEDKTAEEEKQPDGVSTKDGKHIIPYSVLQENRERARKAEEELAETKRRIAELEAKAGAAQSEGVKNEEIAAPQNLEGLSVEELETLKEDFPITHKAWQSINAQLEALKAQLAPVRDTVERQKIDAERTVQEQVQEAIDANPKLAYIASQQGPEFELAKNFDNALKNSPAWANKPMSERFAKVVEMVEAANGQINVPGVKSDPPSKSQEELKAEAQERAKQLAKQNKTSVPSSLSDFPAGQPVSIDEKDAIENMTPLQLAAKFGSMKPDDLEAYLQNL